VTGRVPFTCPARLAGLDETTRSGGSAAVICVTDALDGGE